MPGLKSGDLHHRLAFDAPLDAPDGAYGVETGWTEEYQCRGHIRYLRGSEAVVGARLSGRQPVVVTIRECDAAMRITTDWRMRDVRRGTEFNIRTVFLAEDRQRIEITAESGVAV